LHIQWGVTTLVTKPQTMRSVAKFIMNLLNKIKTFKISKLHLGSLLILLLASQGSLLSNSSIKTDSLTIQLKYAATREKKIRILWELSDYYWSGDIRKAIESAEQALEIAEKTDDKRLLGISYQKLGNSLLLIGDNFNALNNYLKSLSILENVKDEEAIFSLFHNIGVLYDRMQDFDKALVYYEKALHLYINSANQDCEVMQQVHSLYNSIGNIYDQKNQKAKSFEYYQKALQLAVKMKDIQALGVIYNNIGKHYMESNLPDSSLKYFNLSLECRIKEHDINGMAKSHNSLCSYYMKKGDYNLARQNALEALKLSESSGAKTTKLLSLLNLSSIDEASENYKSALYFHKQYTTLNDSIKNEATIKNQTEIQIKNEYEKQEEIKNSELKRKNLKSNVTIITLFAGLIIFLLLYLLAKNRTKRINLENKALEQNLTSRNMDIATKDRELATSVLYLLEKNELLNDISERLLNLKKRIGSEHHSSIQKIIVDIQEGSRKDMWDEFEVKFQQVHDDYFKKLKEYAPDLTPGEIKICTFLKLNMTSKEIAAITRQSIKSIEVTRTRIRKKLQLTNHDTNLVTFLMEL